VLNTCKNMLGRSTQAGAVKKRKSGMNADREIPLANCWTLRLPGNR
jgi:hypothetical protein